MELTSIQIGWLMLGLAVGLLLLGLPVAVTMIIAGVLGMFLIRGWDPSLISLAYITWRQSLNQILVIIPLFMWMGTLAARGGIGEAAFKSLYKWVGQFRGGLTMAVAIATAAFSAISGNHIACAAAMSKVSFPELRRYKYDDGFSLATIAASANLDIMIPPSGAFILYGFLTDTSIPSLFVAGILPGAFIMVLLLIQISVQCRINPSLGPAAPRVGWIDRLKSTYLLLPIVFIFGVVHGRPVLWHFHSHRSCLLGSLFSFGDQFSYKKAECKSLHRQPARRIANFRHDYADAYGWLHTQ